MIKFEEHEGELFRMLDKPVPLTPDAEMPCLTRLIQDDSRMGMFNRDTKPSRLSDIYLVTRIVSNSIIVDEFMESDYHRFEIIGYPVQEGSADWAWYQMMNGEKISSIPLIAQRFYAIKKGCDYCALYENDGREVVDTGGTYDEFIEYSKRCHISWRIYKAPKPESEYKVGDFVEFIDAGGHKSQGKYLSNAYDNAILVRDITYNMRCVVPATKIIRKLSPSELIVRIGCLSGTIKDLSYAEDGRFWFIGGKTERCPGGMHCILYLEMLDTPTRELVESLLKAMEEEK